MSSQPVVIDVLGMRCPIPVHRLRQALRESDGSCEIRLLGDDPESLHDVPALLERLGLPPASITERERGWVFVIRQL